MPSLGTSSRDSDGRSSQCLKSASHIKISGVEKAKLACAERLFDEASTSDVRYHQVADYDDLLQWVGRLE